MFLHAIFDVAFVFLTSTFAQNLEVVVLNTRLPVPISDMAVVYDGDDSIYVLGGLESDAYYGRQDILRFSITEEIIEKVGIMDPVILGSAVWAGDNILHFGGMFEQRPYESKVSSYEPDGQSEWTHVSDLPINCSFTSSVWDQGEYSYVFGGRTNDMLAPIDTISRYISVTNASIVVGKLPTPREGTSAVWDHNTGNAYVFGGQQHDPYNALNDIVKFNPKDGSAVKLDLSLPIETPYSCAVWTGAEAYIIGGLIYEQVFNISRFNPSTYEAVGVRVNNLPSSLVWHGCAFVEKLNRIYILGGSSIDYVARDEIMYIDLGPSPTNPITTTPTTTTTKRPGHPTDCNNEADGTRFPDPYCCKSFYQCGNQEATYRQCPSQLQYNPGHEECDLPEVVKCRTVYE